MDTKCPATAKLNGTRGASLNAWGDHMVKDTSGKAYFACLSSPVKAQAAGVDCVIKRFVARDRRETPAMPVTGECLRGLLKSENSVHFCILT